MLPTFDRGRAVQKAKFMGEHFPPSVTADTDSLSFLEFFRSDRETGRAKAIVTMDVGDLA